MIETAAVVATDQLLYELWLDTEAYSGGAIWAKPPPEPVKSIDFRGFHALTDAEPPLGRKKF